MATVFIHRTETFDRDALSDNTPLAHIGEYMQDHGQGVNYNPEGLDKKTAVNYCLGKFDAILEAGTKPGSVHIDLSKAACKASKADVSEEDVQRFVERAQEMKCAVEVCR